MVDPLKIVEFQNPSDLIMLAIQVVVITVLSMGLSGFVIAKLIKIMLGRG